MEIEEGHFEEMVEVPCRVFFRLMSHWQRHIYTTKHYGATYTLTPQEQVLFFFTHLCYYPVHCLAAHIFNVSKPTAQATAQIVTNYFFNFSFPISNSAISNTIK
jgi:hypothetical protein